MRDNDKGFYVFLLYFNSVICKEINLYHLLYVSVMYIVVLLSLHTSSAIFSKKKHIAISLIKQTQYNIFSTKYNNMCTHVECKFLFIFLSIESYKKSCSKNIHVCALVEAIIPGN